MLYDGAILAAFVVAVIKYILHGNLRNKGIIITHISRAQFIIVGKSKHQELKEYDHITSTIRKQRDRY